MRQITAVHRQIHARDERGRVAQQKTDRRGHLFRLPKTKRLQRVWVIITRLLSEQFLHAGIHRGIDIRRQNGVHTNPSRSQFKGQCRDCRGNFIFVKPKHSAREVANRLETEKKVLVHPYGNELLKDCLRVSVGSVNAMKLFLDAFLEIDGQD